MITYTKRETDAGPIFDCYTGKQWLGALIQEPDGEYCFQIFGRQYGCWTAATLKDISNKLDSLNTKVNEKIPT